MRLSTKSVLIVVLAMIGLVTALHTVATRFIMRSFAALEAQRARELGTHVREVLAFEQRQFGESADDWAKWNDVILYARDRGETWQDENLTPLSYKMKSWTDLMVVRDDRTVVWGKALRSDETFGPAHTGLFTLIERGKLSYPVAEERPIDGLAALDSEVYLVTSRPLQNLAGPTVQHGVLISTQRLDAAWLERFQRITGLDLHFVPAEDESPHAERALLATDGIALSVPSEDNVDIFVKLDEVSGEAPLVAVVHTPRPLVGAARVVLAAVTLALIALGVLAAGATLVLLHFGLVRRLRRLAEASDGLMRGHLIELDGVGGDEIGAFAQEFVAMGRAVLEREESISAATAKKKLVLDNAGNALLTCDTSGRLLGDLSTSALEWFGRSAPGATVWEYLAHGDEALQRELRRDFQSVGRRALDVPLRRTVAGRVLDCRWSSVSAGVAGSIVLLVMHDVTEIVAQRAREEEEREEQRRWSLRSRNAYSERGDRRVGAKEQRALLAQLHTVGAPEATIRSVEAWSKAPLRPIAQGLADMAARVAIKLGKQLTVEVRASSQRIDRERTAPLWASLVHLVRNAVDHGLEPAEERESQGKPAAAALGIAAAVEGGVLTVSVSDDGRGIDWPRVAEKARERGLPHGSRTELEEALFADGLSTRDVASAISGRGVGLASVRQAVLALGGTITVSSVIGEGTQFRIVVPVTWDSPSRDEAVAAPGFGRF